MERSPVTAQVVRRLESIATLGVKPRPPPPTPIKDEVGGKAGALPDGPYRVIYADPPWSYGNSGVIAEGHHYSRAERHYPAMTTAEICALPVKDIAADDGAISVGDFSAS